MKEIALGVKIFQRTEKLETLLESAADQPISKVYVADDGELTEEKTSLYDREYPFDFEVLDLEYDAGLGLGRKRIVEEFEEDYLLIADSDHELIGDVGVLRDQLRSQPDLGGVAGLLWEHGAIKGTCHDIYEGGGVLFRDVKHQKPVQKIAGSPFVPFDFVPNVAMFRKECLDDYCWDSEYIIGKEHLDFYVGHKRLTDWVFGVNPNILFGHHPGGDANYTMNRESVRKLSRSKEYFLDKWGYKQIALGQTDWLHVSTDTLLSPSELVRNISKSILLRTPAPLLAALMDGRDLVRGLRGRPPL